MKRWMEYTLATCWKNEIGKGQFEREQSGLKLLKESYSVFLRKNGRQKVKIITDPKEQKCILEACHSQPMYVILVSPTRHIKLRLTECKFKIVKQTLECIWERLLYFTTEWYINDIDCVPESLSVCKSFEGVQVMAIISLQWVKKNCGLPIRSKAGATKFWYQLRHYIKNTLTPWITYTIVYSIFFMNWLCNFYTKIIIKVAKWQSQLWKICY